MEGRGGEGSGQGLPSSQGADGRWKTGDWNVLACCCVGVVFCRGFGRRRGQQVTVVRTAETGGNDVATRQPKHKQAAKQTARQLRWDPGKQTQALSHSSHKGCRTGQGANRTGPWMLGAGCLVLGDGVGGERGGEGCCMQVQGCKRPNRLSAGEMPGSTRARRDKDNPTQPSQPVSGPEWSGRGKKRWSGKGGGGVPCCYYSVQYYGPTVQWMYMAHSSTCTLTAPD